MLKVNFNDYEELVFFCDDALKGMEESYRSIGVSIIALYNDARKIVNEFCRQGYDLRSIDLHDEEYCNYGSEYIISVIKLNNELEIYCQPMIVGDNYISDESTLCCILRNCSTDVYNYITTAFAFDVSISEYKDNYDEFTKDDYGDDDEEYRRKLLAEDTDFYVGE